MEDVDMAQPDEEDPYDYRPPPGPSPREVQARWVAEGNIDAFLALLREGIWSMLSVGEQLNNIMRACEVRAKADPAAFSDEMFRRMVAFNAFLVIRTQFYVALRTVGRGEWREADGLHDFSVDAVERLLPRLLEMQRGMAELLAGQAATARMWALARSKEAKPDQAGPRVADAAGSEATEQPKVSRKSGKPKPKPQPKPKTPEPARDDVIPLPTRGRRRG